MIKNIHLKTETKLEADSFEIVACHDKHLQSFLNVFRFEGETHTQAVLGSVLGVIQVHDHTEQSAYLPNLIAQVIKKEFYGNPKRTTEESFEAALHKANSALAELAQHELVGWHGKLDTVVGAVNDNHLLFTQANGGKIFLLRDKKISEISKGLDESADNPLKTFSNVSSGTVKNGDKVIFSTESIRESFAMEDLKRHANTFSSDELDNLLKSTIESEGENVGMIVVNFTEKTLSQPMAETKQKTGAVNYFGNAERKARQEKEETTAAGETEQKQAIGLDNGKTPKSAGKERGKNHHRDKKSELSDKQQSGQQAHKKNLSPFEKQPELFIKENDQEEDAENHKNSVSALSIFSKKSKEIFGKIKKTLALMKVKDATLAAKAKTAEFEAEKSKKIIAKARHFTKKTFQPKKNIDQVEELSTEISLVKKEDKRSGLPPAGSIGFFENTDSVEQENFAKISAENAEKDETDKKLAKFWDQDKQPPNEKKQGRLQRFLPKKEALFAGAGKIMQNAKILSDKTIMRKSTNPDEKKISLKKISLAIFLAAIIVGIVWVFWLNKNHNESPNRNATSEPKDELRQDESVLLSGNKADIEKLVDLESDVVSMTWDDGEIFMLTPLNSFYRYDTRNGTLDEIPLGDRIKGAEKIDSIDKLNMILIISRNEVLSYLRVTKSFAENEINLPEDLEIAGTGSYLSFFYLFDKTSGQIYRYPRAEGGFASPKLWLSSTIDASGATDMAVDDSIRIGYADGRMEKYFKSKQESSFLLDSNPKIIPHKIATAIDHDYYYALDNEQGAIAKTSKETNQVQKIYQDEKLKGSRDFYLDAPANNIYFISKNAELIKLALD